MIDSGFVWMAVGVTCFGSVGGEYAAEGGVGGWMDVDIMGFVGRNGLDGHGTKCVDIGPKER